MTIMVYNLINKLSVSSISIVNENFRIVETSINGVDLTPRGQVEVGSRRSKKYWVSNNVFVVE